MIDEVRIASNESLFRQVNDRIEELAISHDFGPWRLGLVCECPSLDECLLFEDPARLPRNDHDRRRRSRNAG